MIRIKTQTPKYVNLNAVLKKRIIFKLLAKFLLYISLIAISTYTFLDYAEYDFHTIKYLLLYSAVMTQIASLAIMYLS